MANRITLLSGLLALASLVPLSFQQPEAKRDKSATPEEQLAAMNWLAGSWSGEMWGGEFQAFYSVPTGGKILSHSQLIKDGKPVFYEFEVFEGSEQALLMRPFPAGKRAVELTLRTLEHEERRATFVNPNKDYPTQITYQRVSENALQIVLSDPHGDSKKVETFDLKRVE